MLTARALTAVTRTRLPGAVCSASIRLVAKPAQGVELRRALHNDSAARAQQLEQSPQVTPPQLSQTTSQVVLHWGDGRSSTL